MSEYLGERLHSTFSPAATPEPLDGVGSHLVDHVPSLATVHRLVEAPGAAESDQETDAVPAAPLQAPWGESLARVLGLFDDEAVRLQALRDKIQQVGSEMSTREQRLRELEGELARAGVERLRDRETIERLQHELAEREGRLHRAGTKIQELAAIVDGGDPR